MSKSLSVSEVEDCLHRGGQLVAITTQEQFDPFTGWVISGEAQYSVSSEVFEQIFKMPRNELPLEIVRTFREGRKHGIVYQLEQQT